MQYSPEETDSNVEDIDVNLTSQVDTLIHLGRVDDKTFNQFSQYPCFIKRLLLTLEHEERLCVLQRPIFNLDTTIKADFCSRLFSLLYCIVSPSGESQPQCKLSQAVLGSFSSLYSLLEIKKLTRSVITLRPRTLNDWRNWQIFEINRQKFIDALQMEISLRFKDKIIAKNEGTLNHEQLNFIIKECALANKHLGGCLHFLHLHRFKQLKAMLTILESDKTPEDKLTYLHFLAIHYRPWWRSCLGKPSKAQEYFPLPQSSQVKSRAPTPEGSSYCSEDNEDEPSYSRNPILNLFPNSRKDQQNDGASTIANTSPGLKRSATPSQLASPA